jgi:hypothetical protein
MLERHMENLMARDGALIFKDQFAKTAWSVGDVLASALRRLKRVRNLVTDPPPRTGEVIYEGYTFAYPEIRFRFRLGKEMYVHRVVLHVRSDKEFRSLAAPEWSALLHHIGLLFAPFHCRLTDLAGVRSTCMPLPVDLRQLHEAMSLNGLAEFRYRSGLDPTRPVLFSSDMSVEATRPLTPPLEDKVLVLNGGGKDSLVAAELFRAINMPFAWFTLGLSAVRSEVIAKSGATHAYSADYHLDPALGANARYSWGPPLVIGLVSSLALIPAVLYGYRYVAIGSEFSANFPTRTFRGMEINHQYGKSFSFESRLADVMARRLVEGIKYFSVLRPFYEIRLAAMFSRFDQYFESFISCNKGIGRGAWCKNCPKCAFVFLILYPFLDAAQLRRIFGEDLFQRRHIRVFILDLVSAGRKPWECVGTQQESQLALLLSLKKSPDLVFAEWPYRDDLERACASLDANAATEEFLHGFHGPHRIPDELAARLQAVTRRWTS